MKIYIAGKITGEPVEACKQKFEKISDALKQVHVIPINPFKLGCKDHWTFDQCKPFNFKSIRQCDAIFMLEDYQDSPGAIQELAEAKKLNIPVYYQSANDYFLIVEDFKLEFAS